jgi:hypothetical protein
MKEYIDGVMFPSDLQGTVLESVWATEAQLNNDEYMEGKPGSGSVPYMDDFWIWAEANYSHKETQSDGWDYYTFCIVEGRLDKYEGTNNSHYSVSPL